MATVLNIKAIFAD